MNNKKKIINIIIFKLPHASLAYQRQMTRSYQIKIIYTWIITQNYVERNQIIYIPILYRDMGWHD